MSEPPVRIMLVDDVRLFRELEKSFLQRSGYEILSATTGIEALEKARRYRPRLILLDCQMPGMDGIECCRRIKSDEALKETKVVMVTTRGGEEDRRKCIEAGCDGFLAKPIKRREFHACIQAALYAPVRTTERLPISVKVSFAAKNGPELNGVSLNISAAGMFIVTEEFPDPGTSLSLSFVLPGLEGRFGLAAEIVWSTKEISRGKSSCAGFGVRFTGIDIDAARRIEEFVSERLV